MSTTDPDEGRETPQPDPEAGGSGSLRGPWEGESGGEGAQEQDLDESRRSAPDDAGTDGEREDGDEAPGSGMAPDRGPWE